VVALLALLLMFGTTVQLTHIHLDAKAHQDCALCQSAHNVIRPAVAAPVQRSIAVVRRVAVPLTRQYREHIFSFSHWNRPPPTGAIHS